MPPTRLGRTAYLTLPYLTLSVAAILGGGAVSDSDALMAAVFVVERAVVRINGRRERCQTLRLIFVSKMHLSGAPGGPKFLLKCRFYHEKYVLSCISVYFHDLNNVSALKFDGETD